MSNHKTTQADVWLGGTARLEHVLPPLPWTTYKAYSDASDLSSVWLQRLSPAPPWSPPRPLLRPREYTCVDLFEGFLQLRVRNLQMRVQNVQNQNPIFSARSQRTSNLVLHFPGRDSAGHRDRKSLGRFVQLVDAMEVFSYGSRSLKNVTALCLKAFINRLGVIVLDVVPQLPNAFVPLLNIGLQERGQAKGSFQRFFPSASLFSKRYLQRQKRGKERPNCRPCIPVNQTFTAEPPALTDAIQHTHSLIPLWIRRHSATPWRVESCHG
ncbi:TPA: hypothetical protein UM365_000186 [Stenotrophomonas maltophilia]|uniref:hypothetical protein n=1 Tax=Stenotrophomonas TaxID=40323 RepID=UPI000AF6967D|nr:MULTISPECIES: hypothetical protein [Stenotrophomonas]MBH1498349.1 hypothetical protein [Stenotrophomonas maltophilia]MBH1534522.1 hypothetical protein [Stenotrophomonas maltophilia]MBH1744497.1 hypothetical protein [Stenotrophomonas maltophilia]MBN4945700.1 hypothetical protein [Stenotrophomonas maltophilia]MCF3550838.1 hypothetical protein [Stenotrophomonas maltophilia]